MNGRLGNVDDLVAHVQRRAEQKAVALESAGRERAAEIEARGADEAERVRREIVDAGRLRAAEAQRQRLATAELARRHRRLAAREGRLERVWEAAERALARHAEGGVATDILRDLALDASRHLGGDEVTVKLDAASLATVDADVVAGWSDPAGPRLVLDPEPLPRGHGVVARSGRASVDATFEGRLDVAKSELRAQVDGLLSRSGDNDHGGPA